MNPALMATAANPVTKPGAMPGFPAMENAMPVAMMTGSSPNALPPSVASAWKKSNFPMTSESWYLPPKAMPMAMRKPAPHTIGIR
jgi:hypothetical protein